MHGATTKIYGGCFKTSLVGKTKQKTPLGATRHN
jgi:hypothetical protein